MLSAKKALHQSAPAGLSAKHSVASVHAVNQALAAQHAPVDHGPSLQNGASVNADTHSRTSFSSDFSLDDPLIPELISWISCAAILGGLAGSFAIASCCKALAQSSSKAQALPPQSPSSSSSSSSNDDSSDELDDLLAQYEIDLEAAEALQKAS